MSGRRKKHAHEEHHVDERWLVSYADMITVLMALFIVLYAMSTVDQKKFDELKNSLATGFGVTKTAKVDENTGVVRKQDVKKKGSGFSNSTIALMQVAKEITDELKTAGVAGKAVVKSGSNSITISLVGSSTYFDGNSDVLRPEALHVLRAVSTTLRKHAGRVTIEGHADPGGSAGAFGNDWYLAGARANRVLSWLIEQHSVDPADISSVSHGSEHASRTGTAKAAEHNRRVDIVLHSVQVATPSAATADSKSASTKSTSTKTAESKSASTKTAESKSASTKSAAAESATTKTSATATDH